MGHLLKLKYGHSPLNPRILSSASVPFTLTTVQVPNLPNLALTHTKRVTVYAWYVYACSAGLTARNSKIYIYLNAPLSRFYAEFTPMPLAERRVSISVFSELQELKPYTKNQ